MARFCIEENSFKLTADKSIVLLVERLISQIDEIKQEGQYLTCWSEVYYLTIIPGLTVLDLLFDTEKTPLDPLARRTLMEQLNRCKHWDDFFTPTGKVMKVGESQEKNNSIEYVIWERSRGRAIACVCLDRNESGPLLVQADQEEHLVHFLVDLPGRLSFYRYIINFEDFDEKEFIDHTHLAFPDLFFKPDIHKEFRKLRQTYKEARPSIVHHLSILNDHFSQVFDRHKGASDPIKREMSSHQISVSPESPKTHKNRAAMKKRKIVIDTESIICEWHTKLTPTFDRIYFHPGTPKLAQKKVIIGIIHEHLPT